jgi:hypothetical protein
MIKVALSVIFFSAPAFAQDQAAQALASAGCGYRAALREP